MKNVIWRLVQEADSVSTGVLVLLLFMSILCWTIFLYKMLLFYKEKRKGWHTLRTINAFHHFGDLLKHTKPHGVIIDTIIAKHKDRIVSFLFQEKMNKTHLSFFFEKETMEDAIEEYIDQRLQKKSTLLFVIVTCASIAPLLGLFGTVWGLVHSFISIAEQKSADIVTVAPGIAEAFITTLAGLCVAIPALMLYAILRAQLRSLEYLLVQIKEHIMALYLQTLYGDEKK